jgi:Cu/Ag efflux protein CusF
MKSWNFAAPIAGLALIASACTQATTPAPRPLEAPAEVLSGTVAEGAATVTATVRKIDLKKRRVTLEGPDGKTVTVKVPEAARNLAQVKVGDEVVVAFYESIAYEVKKPGEASPGVAVAEEAGRSEPGEKPGGFAAEAVTVTITAIDRANSTVTLELPDGETDTVKVRDPSRLEGVEVGDLVELTYTEAVAISVVPGGN